MPRLQIVADDALAAQIKMRGEVSEVGRTSLERYYLLLSIARAEMLETFTEGELGLLADICNGTLFEPYEIALRMLFAEAEDCEEFYYHKWEATRHVLVAKLNALLPIQSAALIDSIERFWRAAGTGMSVDPRKLLDDPKAP